MLLKNRAGQSETKPKLNSLSPIPFSPGSTSLLPSFLLYLLPLLNSAGGWARGKLWSVHNSSCLLLLPPHAFPLLPVSSSLQAAGESLLWHLKHLLPILLLQRCCMQGHSHTFFTLLTPLWHFFWPFLITFSPPPWPRVSAVPCSGLVGAVWNGLTEAAPQPPCYRNLAE